MELELAHRCEMLGSLLVCFLVPKVGPLWDGCHGDPDDHGVLSQEVPWFS